MDHISDVGKGREYLVEDDRPSMSQQAGQRAQPNTVDIGAAMERLVAESREGNGLEIEFYDDVPLDELPPELQAVVLPVVQELLQNACRHSKSKNVLVGLSRDDGRVCIQVQDWGVGFDREIVPRHERGLKAVRQLAQWRGGTMNVDSRPGAGTCIVVEIPLFSETESGDQRNGNGQDDTRK
jgi:signal transduction histidine kinase